MNRIWEKPETQISTPLSPIYGALTMRQVPWDEFCALFVVIPQQPSRRGD